MSDPGGALRTLSARGEVDFGNLAVRLVEPAFFSPAGLHPAGGGDGTFACPVEIFLAGLVSCAGVTLAAVATSMQLAVSAAEIICHGSIDFRGTLAVERSAPVALTSVRLEFVLATGEPDGKIEKLLELTHRYCVVHRTLDAPPAVDVKWRRGGE